MALKKFRLLPVKQHCKQHTLVVVFLLFNIINLELNKENSDI